MAHGASIAHSSPAQRAGAVYRAVQCYSVVYRAVPAVLYTPSHKPSEQCSAIVFSYARHTVI